MEDNVLLERLKEAGILDCRDGDGDIADDVVADIENRGKDLTNTRWEELRPETADDRVGLCDISASDEFKSTYITLYDELEWEDNYELLRLSSILYQSLYLNPQLDGCPKGFFGVTRESLCVLPNVNPKAILYVWIEDCEPCETMKKTLGKLAETGITDVSLLSTNGNNNVEYLYERYDIASAPVTLFLHQTDVDTRYYGAVSSDALTNELEYLQSL